MDTLKHWNGVRNNAFLSTLLDLDVVCLHGCVTSLAVEIKCTEIQNSTFNWRIKIFIYLIGLVSNSVKFETLTLS
jgi:hypothetical protein